MRLREALKVLREEEVESVTTADVTIYRAENGDGYYITPTDWLPLDGWIVQRKTDSTLPHEKTCDKCKYWGASMGMLTARKCNIFSNPSFPNFTCAKFYCGHWEGAKRHHDNGN